MKQSKNNYPSIKQAIVITLLILLSMGVIGGAVEYTQLFKNKDFSMLASYVLGLLIPVALLYFKKYKTSEKSSLKNKPSLLVILLSTVAVICLQLSVTMPVVELIPMPESIKQMFMELAKNSGKYVFIAAVIVAPVVEEFVFRGVILKGFLKRYSPLKSILISSILFGFVHLNPWQFITAMIIGSFSGWLYYKTKSLQLSIHVHMVNNLFATLFSEVLGKEKSMDMSMSEMLGGTHVMIAVIAGGLIISVFSIWKIHNYLINNKTEELDDQISMILNNN